MFFIAMTKTVAPTSRYWCQRGLDLFMCNYLMGRIVAMHSGQPKVILDIVNFIRNNNLKDNLDVVLSAIKEDARNIDYLFNLGIECAESDNLTDAVMIFDCLQAIVKNDVRIPFNLGFLNSKLGNFNAALEAFNLAIQISPKDIDSILNKGITLHELKRFLEALDLYEKAQTVWPDSVDLLVNKGATLYELKRYEEALSHFDRVINIQPDYLNAYLNKGNALSKLNQIDEAIANYDVALKLDSACIEAWSNKAYSLHNLGRFSEAIKAYDRAIFFKADYAEAWSNKGITLLELKQYQEAIAHQDKALSFKPNYAEALVNNAVVMVELKRYREALTYYEKALDIKQDLDWIFGDYLHLKMKLCDWDNLQANLEKLVAGIQCHQRITTIFPLLSQLDLPMVLKKWSEFYSRTRYPLHTTLGSISKHEKQEKIRIGYFSADFRVHPVAFLTAELFEQHDKDQFEIIAFSFGENDQSPIRSRIAHSFSRFLDVKDMSDREVAKLSRSLGIDIAVDLSGFTADCRTGIFSYRAAPIQLSYIGFLGTMGTEYVDYLIADKTIIPEGLENLYSEKIVYLPSYQVNDSQRMASEKVFTRAELGLPEEGFVFACFNSNYKILPATFNGWMSILKKTEGSVLFLYADNQWAQENLIKEAQARGIESSRLVFGKHMPMGEYLARYKACDLFLDTYPYNAGTTASDALWMGLPVLTLSGKSFASRVAASLLTAIGLPELITTTQADYEALAIELASNPERLAEIKQKLANNRLSTPLFDTPLFTKNLEKAYIQMYDRYLAGLPLDDIA